MRRFPRSFPLTAALVGLAAMGPAGCAPVVGEAAGATDQGPAAEVRLGYFPTVTHAPALVGVSRGIFTEALGSTTLSTQVFTAGPAAIEALNAGAVDATFVGPNPAINGYVASGGDALRIVAGSTSGGAQLVVRPGITTAADLRGATLATPQLGGTQDVALRAWSAHQGLRTTLRGDGDLRITPTAPAVALQLFRDGEIDGAWLPEPWASRLVLEAGGTVLVDERDLWPEGRFPTTSLVVAARFLAEHPSTVEDLVRGTVETIAWLDTHPDEAASVLDDEIAALTGQALGDAVLTRALSGVTFTADPLAWALPDLHAAGRRVGTAPAGSLAGIDDLRALDAVLDDLGLPAVDDAGAAEPAPSGGPRTD